MSNALSTAGLFLINTLFDLYLLVLMLRLILCWVGANYFNPLSQIVIKLTQPLIAPIRRRIPNIKNLETSTLIVILVLEIIKYILIGLIATGMPTNVFGLFILAVADSLKLMLDVLFYAILIQAILSWVKGNYSPISQVLLQITAPLMRPFQRIIPLVGGMDLSPIPALITLQLITILIVKPLIEFGAGITFG